MKDFQQRNRNWSSEVNLITEEITHTEMYTQLQFNLNLNEQTLKLNSIDKWKQIVLQNKKTLL